MNLSVNAQNLFSSLSSVSGLSSVSSTSGSSELEGLSGLSFGEDQIDVSKPTELYAKLQELAESDPEKLKEVCGSIAEQLEAAAEEDDSFGGQMLSDLAEKFQSVAEGGDLSQLEPPSGPPPGGPRTPQGKYDEQEQLLQSLFSDQQTQGTSNTTNLDDLLSTFITQVEDALGE